MNVAWLIVFFIVFGAIAIAATAYYIPAKRKKGESWRRRKPFIRIIIAASTVLALTSIFFCIGTYCFGKETTVDEVIGDSSTRIVYLTGFALEGEGDYLLSSDDEYQYFYYDDNGKVQIGHAPAEDSDKYYGNLDGKACVIITTTPHRIWKRWLCFGYNTYPYTKTYDFYIP